MVTYKGLPGPVISEHLGRRASRERYTEGTEFHIGRIEMVANTGTYIDSPFHRFEKGKDLSDLSLESLANVPVVMVRATGRGRAIRADHMKGLNVDGKAVLVHTGWDKNWRTEKYFEGHPYLTADAADFLAGGKAAIVGIDSYNIDDTADGRRPVHTTLLGAGIPIVEHLCGLEHVPEGSCRFFAVPVKVKHFGSFPVRAFVQAEEQDFLN